MRGCMVCDDDLLLETIAAGGAWRPAKSVDDQRKAATYWDPGLPASQAPTSFDKRYLKHDNRAWDVAGVKLARTL